MSNVDIRAARKMGYRYGRQIWQSSRDGNDTGPLMRAAGEFMAQFKEDPIVAAYVRDAYYAGVDGDEASDEANGFMI